MQYYPAIKFLLAETSLKVDGAFIDALLELTKRINIILSSRKDADKDLNISELVFTPSSVAWVIF